ncbi:MAG: hypothetical protein ACRYFK_20660 [Janthinobacterium lividum]
MPLKKPFRKAFICRGLALILLLLGQLGTARADNFFFASPAAAPSAQLRQADSLFVSGQYAAAVPLYRAQVWRRRQVSGQLLLRLAYAEHRLGHLPAEMLYLNLALARQPRLSTWQRLVGLAQRQRLVGYPSTWQQELRIGVARYYYPALQVLLSGAVLGAALLGLRRRAARRGTWLSYGAYLLATGAFLYGLQPRPTGIVARPGAALMAGPSAGAAWLSTATLGDRLPVLGRQDIWLRVRWQERVAYVRAADALVVE